MAEYPRKEAAKVVRSKATLLDDGKRNADEGAGEEDGEAMTSYDGNNEIDDEPISFDASDDMNEVRGINDEM